MKTIVASAIIFLCLLGFVVYADNTLDTLCDKTINKCDEVIDQLNNNDWNSAIITSNKIMHNLKNSSFMSSIYISHTDYDILYNEALRLYSYVKQNDSSESFTSAKLLKSYSVNIKHLHQLNIKNII